MLFRKLTLAVILLCALPFSVYAENTYKYKDVCPSPAGGNMWVDDWGFYKCECTSYVAFKLNEDGISFHNHYKGVHWGDAGNWKSAANSVGMPVYDSPEPGDVAWWSGHVAYVERVDYVDGQWEKVYISEYNYEKPHDYGTKHGSFRVFTPQSSNKPIKYIRFRPSPSYFYVSEGNIHIAWSPSNVPCDKARVWSYNQTCSAENSHPEICQTAYDELLQANYNEYSKDKYNTMFFGSIKDFQQFCQ